MRQDSAFKRAFILLLIVLLPLLFAAGIQAQSLPETKAAAAEQAQHTVEQLDAPLYSAFTERYILDELKSLLP